MTLEVTPTLSTVVLNWNRSDLLERTIRSYLATVSVPYELTVVDNASGDDSLVFLHALRREFPYFSIVSQPDNRGGESLNDVLTLARGEFLHISENDVEYRPGWDRTMLSCFASFPQLGQLSPFGPVPEDDEIWETKSGHPCYVGGNLIYVTEGNVGTSCILRRELWNQGVRLFNIPNAKSSVRLPDDGRLSGSVRALGYWVAWSGNYLAKNLGHSHAEFERRQSYYRRNYAAKTWLDIEGWEQRVSEWESRPKPIRRSHLYPETPLSAEMASFGVPRQQSLLWSMINALSGEIEVLELIHALIRTLKPLHVLETETGLGYVTTAVCEALRLNGQGHLTSISCHPDQLANNQGLVEAYCQLTLLQSADQNGPCSDAPLDCLIVNNSQTDVVANLFAHIHRLRDGALVVMRTTDCGTADLAKRMRWPARMLGMGTLSFRVPRGLVIYQFRRTLRSRLIASMRHLVARFSFPLEC